MAFLCRCSQCGAKMFVDRIGSSCGECGGIMEFDTSPDMVNHPPHYTKHPSGIECIEITRHMSFNTGNAMKYLWRSDHKNGKQDLEKAIWYIQDEIKRLYPEPPIMWPLPECGKSSYD